MSLRNIPSTRVSDVGYFQSNFQIFENSLPTNLWNGFMLCQLLLSCENWELWWWTYNLKCRRFNYSLSAQILTVYQLNSINGNQIFPGTDTIDECSSNPCENNGTCADDIGGYTCTCLAGYTGSSCESGGFEQSVDNVCWNSFNIIWNISTTQISGVIYKIKFLII